MLTKPLTRSLMQDTLQVIKNEGFHQDTMMVGMNNFFSGGKFLTQPFAEPVIIRPELLEIIFHDWQLITLGTGLLLIALVRIGSRNFFRNIRTSFFSLPIFRQMIRDGELFPQGSFVPLTAANLIIMATFLYNMIEWSGSLFLENVSHAAVAVSKIILVLLAYYVFQYFILRFTGFVFKTGPAAKRYLLNINYYRLISSFFLIPLLLFNIYSISQMLLISSLAIWIIIYLIRLVRGMTIVWDVQGYSRFQNLLYICALEILPVFVLVKFLAV